LRNQASRVVFCLLACLSASLRVGLGIPTLFYHFVEQEQAAAPGPVGIRSRRRVASRDPDGYRDPAWLDNRLGVRALCASKSRLASGSGWGWWVGETIEFCTSYIERGTIK
jgi:hypothetical protein